MNDKKSWVDKNHYRKTSSDGKTSRLYEVDNRLFQKDDCIEIADHSSDGKTTAYEYDSSFSSSVFTGGRGKKK